MVPHLTTALSGPLRDLEHHIIDAQVAIEHWFRSQWIEHSAPFYTSVDLRNSGFKIAPIDTNLFPGGFNNLNLEFMPLCVQATMVAVEKICPESQRFLLVPENHTRNAYYLQNVSRLATILRHAGLSVRIGSLLPDIAAPTEIALPDGGALTLEPIQRVGNRLMIDGFDPCAVLLNNDLSSGAPPILQDLEQVVVPPLAAGWATRRKSRHFGVYARVAEEFAQLIGIDPWLINPYFAYCGQVDFAAATGEECLVGWVDQLLTEVAKKYKEYAIEQPPFLIVKADAGTYGMGIMTVKSVDDVRNLNRKQRNKMSVIKEGQQVTQVIIQEGVYTFESVNDAVAEPVIYMIDHFIVGGFYRVHTARGTDENLNSPGMQFVPLAFEAPRYSVDVDEKSDAPNRFYTYGVVARLAMLAAAIELEAMADE